eukprot:m.225974 g.225974  ORF g.225974 m.225974 type:complete len:53 (+) comp15656_c0_seq3:9110-9268(+)
MASGPIVRASNFRASDQDHPVTASVDCHRLLAPDSTAAIHNSNSGRDEPGIC